jgi:hypothetical protein
MGKSAVHACPAPGHDLEQTLASVEARLSTSVPPEVLKESQEQVEAELDKWGSLTAAHLRGKADEVKELLIMLLAPLSPWVTGTNGTPTKLVDLSPT